MPKINVILNEYNGKKYHMTQYEWMCLGCGYTHVFALKSEGGHHEFNMDLNNPTVSPSLVADFTPGRKCHTYIKNGTVEYLGDCWHHLKGTTIPLPEIESK